MQSFLAVEVNPRGLLLLTNLQGEVVETLVAHDTESSPVMDVVALKGGRFATLGGEEKNDEVKIWDAESLRCVHTLRLAIGPNSEYYLHIRGVAALPCGRLAVSKGFHSAIEIWSTETWTWEAKLPRRDCHGATVTEDRVAAGALLFLAVFSTW